MNLYDRHTDHSEGVKVKICLGDKAKKKKKKTSSLSSIIIIRTI